MKKVIAILLIFLSILNIAIGEAPATPTDMSILEVESEEFDLEQAIEEYTLEEPLEEEELEEIDWGEIQIPFERKVFVNFTLDGNEVTLIAILVDFLPTDQLRFIWQYSPEDDLLNWIDIEGATERTYTFLYDEDHLFWYRVIVVLEGEE